MTSSIMDEPFVVPIGRDYAPRMTRRTADGYFIGAIDDLALDELLQNGISRTVSFYTTHTMADMETIAQDRFYLANPLFNVKIPCQISYGGATPWHATAEVDYYAIPEKLWHQFRKQLFTGGLGPQWIYGTTELRMLRLDMKLVVASQEFQQLVSIFGNNKNNTLPLHLFHCWTYKGTEVQFVSSGTDDWARVVGEKEDPIGVVNIWKDFLIVRRDEVPNRIVLGVASDFHYAERNKQIIATYPNCEDINRKVNALALEVDELWRHGKLDYLVLNGDFIDFLSEKPTSPSWRPPDYSDSNWHGFEQAVRLLGPLEEPWWCRQRSWFPWEHPRISKWFKCPQYHLFNVPLIWNLGDHDRLRYPYSPPTSMDSDTSHEASHYNFQDLRDNEGLEFAVSLLEEGDERYDSALRFVFERSRMSGWPVSARLRAGETEYMVACLDTGPIKTAFPQETPDEPLMCMGIQPIAMEPMQTASDFRIVFTHAPPICRPPNDPSHADGGVFSASESGYGTFEQYREPFLNKLSDMVENGKPTLVVSGHVHFASVYNYTNTTVIETGPRIRDRIRRLSESPTFHPRIPPEVFWQEIPCLLITTTPIGPRSVMSEQKSALLLLELGSDGVSQIQWKEL